MNGNHPQVTLRAMEPEDLDLLYQIENDREIWDVGQTNVPYSYYTLRNYIANSTSDIYADRQVRLMIVASEHGTVGIVDLINFDPQHNRAEVGIVIRKSFRHLGFANAAMTQLVDYSRKVLHLHQLYAFVAKDNEPSMRLFSQLGFSATSELKDWLYDGEVYHSAMLMQFFL